MVCICLCGEYRFYRQRNRYFMYLTKPSSLSLYGRSNMCGAFNHWPSHQPFQAFCSIVLYDLFDALSTMPICQALFFFVAVQMNISPCFISCHGQGVINCRCPHGNAVVFFRPLTALLEKYHRRHHSTSFAYCFTMSRHW